MSKLLLNGCVYFLPCSCCYNTPGCQLKWDKCCFSGPSRSQHQVLTSHVRAGAGAGAVPSIRGWVITLLYNNMHYSGRRELWRSRKYRQQDSHNINSELDSRTFDCGHARLTECAWSVEIIIPGVQRRWHLRWEPGIVAGVHMREVPSIMRALTVTGASISLQAPENIMRNQVRHLYCVLWER